MCISARTSGPFLISFAITNSHFKTNNFFHPMFPLLGEIKQAYLTHSLSIPGFHKQFLKMPLIETIYNWTLYTCHCPTFCANFSSYHPWTLFLFVLSFPFFMRTPDLELWMALHCFIQNFKRTSFLLCGCVHSHSQKTENWSVGWTWLFRHCSLRGVFLLMRDEPMERQSFWK